MDFSYVAISLGMYYKSYYLSMPQEYQITLHIEFLNSRMLDTNLQLDTRKAEPLTNGSTRLLYVIQRPW